LNSNAKPPAYEAIAYDIREKIRDGGFQPGQKLPSARLLCEQYNVSTITIKGAIKLLQNEGAVYGIQGKGIFVSTDIPEPRSDEAEFELLRRDPRPVHQAERATRLISLYQQRISDLSAIRASAIAQAEADGTLSNTAMRSILQALQS